MTKRKPVSALLQKRYYDITSEDVESWWKMYEEGYSLYQLEKLLGIGYWTIKDRFLRASKVLRTPRCGYYLSKSQKRVGGSGKGKFGPDSNVWKGGRIEDDGHGYVLIRCTDHPKARNGYMREHRLVWERANGMYLPDGWHIHHLNGIKNDNRLENLLALPSKEHRLVLAKLSAHIKMLEDEIEVLKGRLKLYE